MSITTTSRLESYLSSAGIRYVAVEPLSGGTANFVWRLTLPSGETQVVKHAEPFIKNNPDFAFPVERMEFEASAYSLIPQAVSSIHISPSAPVVRVPTLHHSDPDAHILIMADCGPSNLKTAYADPALDIPAIGASLGTWLAALHSRTAALMRARDNVTARNVYRYSYANLASAFEKFGLDPALARYVDEEFGPKLLTDDQCVCHGDFWPGNVLVRTGGEGAGETTLSVVDWEMVRRGLGCTDVAQFSAEAYMLDRLCGGRGLLKAFLDAYVEGAAIPAAVSREEFVRRLVVHCGVHLGFWPSVVKWCEEEQTGELMRLGRDLIIAGRDGDWDKVREGPLAPVLRLLE